MASTHIEYIIPKRLNVEQLQAARDAVHGLDALQARHAAGELDSETMTGQAVTLCEGLRRNLIRLRHGGDPRADRPMGSVVRVARNGWAGECARMIRTLFPQLKEE